MSGFTRLFLGIGKTTIPEIFSANFKYRYISGLTANNSHAGFLPLVTSNTFCPELSLTASTSILEINSPNTNKPLSVVLSHKSILSPG